jgi:hypothetical protein
LQKSKLFLNTLTVFRVFTTLEYLAD